MRKQLLLAHVDSGKVVQKDVPPLLLDLLTLVFGGLAPGDESGFVVLVRVRGLLLLPFHGLGVVSIIQQILQLGLRQRLAPLLVVPDFYVAPETQRAVCCEVLGGHDFSRLYLQND